MLISNNSFFLDIFEGSRYRKHAFPKICHLNSSLFFTEEKKPKVKKPKSEFPVYTVAETNAYMPSYDHGTSIEEIEDQMDDWLEDRNKSLKKKASICLF